MTRKVTREEIRPPAAEAIDLAEFIRCGTIAHGHSCPPLVLGVRAGLLAVRRLGIGRAIDRELFAFVELGSDHYAQGFADGIQIATGCTFGKDLIVRLPEGKVSVRLVDQAGGRAVRVVPRPETIAALERSEWFHACSVSASFTSACGRLADRAIDDIVQAPDDALFAVTPVFPLRIESSLPVFESIECEACGENVLASYARELNGQRLCVSCEERRGRTPH